jgi:hypothetical protein
MDTPETLAAAMLAAASEAAVGTRAIVAKGALNIKNDAKRNVRESAPVHNAHAAEAITYDTKFQGSSVMAEIGYDKSKRGGSLGNLLEYGSAHNPAHRDLGRAADNEESRFGEAIALMAEKLL